MKNIKDLVPGDYIAFMWDYYNKEENKHVEVAQISFINDDSAGLSFTVHFLYGHTSVSEFIYAADVLAYGDHENGDVKLIGWGGKFVLLQDPDNWNGHDKIIRLNPEPLDPKSMMQKAHSDIIAATKKMILDAIDKGGVSVGGLSFSPSDRYLVVPKDLMFGSDKFDSFFNKGDYIDNNFNIVDNSDGVNVSREALFENVPGVDCAHIASHIFYNIDCFKATHRIVYQDKSGKQQILTYLNSNYPLKEFFDEWEFDIPHDYHMGWNIEVWDSAADSWITFCPTLIVMYNEDDEDRPKVTIDNIADFIRYADSLVSESTVNEYYLNKLHTSDELLRSFMYVGNIHSFEEIK